MTSRSLKQHDIHLAIDAGQKTFTVQIGPASLTAVCRAAIRKDGGKPSDLLPRHTVDISQQPIRDAHGPGERLTAQFETGHTGLTLHFEAAIYEQHRFLALRVGLENTSHETVHGHSLTPLASKRLDFGSGPLGGWVNGYQSWGFSGLVPHDQRQPRTPFGPMTRAIHHNPTTRRPRGAGRYAAEEVGALIDGGQGALVAGFIELENQFGQVYADGRPGHQSITLQTTADGVQIRPGETLWGAWAILYYLPLPHPNPLGIYAEAVTRITPGRCPESPPLPGWSSWYQFFNKVTAEDMARNQQALNHLRHRLPLPVIQLDDGYQPAWGDWLETNEKFPAGIAAWAEGVRADDFEPGLWLSPFTVDAKSGIYAGQPETLLRNRRGKPTRGGFLFDHWIYGLDPTHPRVKAFVHEVIDCIVNEWGIKYLKLDFLYCAALPGQRHDPTRTRAQALRDGLKLIRETAGEEATIVGCGCPFGPALGLVDIMRIGPDVAPRWYPEFAGLERPFRDDPNMPATRSAIRNTINRLWTHRRWWWIDADNLMIRENQEMTAAEVQTLASVMGLTESHFVLSDDLPGVADQRLDWAAALLPVTGGKNDQSATFLEQYPQIVVQQVDTPAGGHTLAALINWGDTPADLSIRVSQIGLAPDQAALIGSFWDGQATIQTGEVIEVNDVPAHGTALLAVRPLEDGPQYAGSSLHISMGGEITAWEASSEKLAFTISLGRQATGTIWLKLPGAAETAIYDGQEVPLIRLDETDLYALPVQVEGRSDIVIRF